MGLCTTWSETKWGSSSSFPTHEMRSRFEKKRTFFKIIAMVLNTEVIFVVYGLEHWLLYHPEPVLHSVFLVVMLEVWYKYD